MQLSRKNKERAKTLLANLPFLGPPVIAFLLKKRFPVEISLVEGKDPATSSEPSWMHFSVNKAATQYVKSVMASLAESKGLLHASMHDYAFHSELPFFDHLTAEEVAGYSQVFKPQGYLYGPFGGMIEGIQELEKYKVVLVVRDPRDMAVSAYFSKGKSHGLPLTPAGKREAFIRDRDKTQNKSIEEHVLDYAPEVLREFDRYKEHLLQGNYQVHLCKYEQMVTDFPQWLDDLVAFCCGEIDPSLRDEIIRRHEAMKPVKEDPSKHIRKGQPGDYKEKLDQPTIAKLNEIFKEHLEFFDYLDAK